MYKILFVCSANKSRSPTFEAYTKHFVKQRKINKIQINSAGTYEKLIHTFMKTRKTSANPKIRCIMLKEGFPEISAHRTKSVSKNLVKNSSLILTVSQKNKEKMLERFPESKEKTFTIKEYLGMKGDIIDAHYHKGGSIMYDKTTRKETVMAYRKMLSEIKGLSEMILDKISQKSQKKH